MRYDYLLFALTIALAILSIRTTYKHINNRGEKKDCCPECGGREFFDGYGVCQPCEPF